MCSRSCSRNWTAPSAVLTSSTDMARVVPFGACFGVIASEHCGELTLERQGARDPGNAEAAQAGRDRDRRRDEAEACGIVLPKSGAWNPTFRVTSDGGTRATYLLDRWD